MIEDLLKQVKHALGAKTYSAAVNLSLAEILRVKKVQALPEFFGKGLWKGELCKMREDRPSVRRRKTTKK